MAVKRDRCNHCGRWVEPFDLVLPTDESDGSLCICTRCSKLHDSEYWSEWEQQRSVEK